jgi:hypothetical protein
MKKILRLSASVALVSSLCGLVCSSMHAQAAKPQSGTLVIKVPRGFLPSDDYWLYVNGKMLSAQPHPAFTTLNREFMHVAAGSDAAPSDEYWDATGRAAVCEAGRWTFPRAGVRERVFEAVTLAEPPRKYVVELMTRSANKPFPFAIARMETDIAAGATQTIELGIPPGTDEAYIVQASRCSTCSISIHPPAQTLEFIHGDLNRTVAALDANPIVAALDEMLANLSVTPGRTPTVSATLPLAMGGGRELDARQVSLILTALQNSYGFPDIDQNAKLQSAEPPTPQLAAALSLRIKQHNARIDKFQKIVAALEQAKR